MRCAKRGTRRVVGQYVQDCNHGVLLDERDVMMCRRLVRPAPHRSLPGCSSFHVDAQHPSVLVSLAEPHKSQVPAEATTVWADKSLTDLRRALWRKLLVPHFEE